MTGGSDIRALLKARLGGTPYLEGALELLARAIDSSERETFLVEEREGDRLRGVVLYGWVGGAVGTGKIHFVIPEAGAHDEAEIGLKLCREVLRMLGVEGARLVVAELPDDPALAWMLALVHAAGWSEEGSVPDFYRDGVALLLLRRTTA